MRIYLLVFSIYFSFTSQLFSQELSNYRYVQVPEKFEFLDEENQYQLNALTAFLLEKYGFEVLYKDRLPQDVNVCDILKADVHKKSAIFSSRIYVTLKDCNDRELFTSKVGTSREKDYKRSYQEALREAFTSFEELKKDSTVIIDPVPASEIAEKQELPAEVIVDPVPGVNEEKGSDVIIDPVVTSEEVKPSAENVAEYSPSEEVQYTNGAVLYYLRKTPAGYDLFKNGQKTKFGSLIKSSGGEHFLYSSKNVSGNAFFDTYGNLVVEYLDPNSQQLISVIYKRKDQ